MSRRTYASDDYLLSERHARRQAEKREKDGRPTSSIRPIVDRLTPVVEQAEWALDDLITELETTVRELSTRYESAFTLYKEEKANAEMIPLGYRATGWNRRMNDAYSAVSRRKRRLQEAESRLSLAQSTRQWYQSNPTQWSHCTAHVLDQIRYGDLTPTPSVNDESTATHGPTETGQGSNWTG